jgi:serine/threonine protein kinase
MSGFSTTLKQLCAGTAGVDAVLAALHREPPENSRQHALAIESAWRGGKIDRQSYDVLRSAVRAAPAAVANGDPVAAGEDAVFTSWSPSLGPVIPDEEIRAERPHAEVSGTRLRKASDARSDAPASAANFAAITNPQWPTKTVAPGTLLKDRFVLEEIIGRGGMGTIYRARDVRKEEAQDRNPYVAVKVLNEDFRQHPEALKALQRESRKTQGLAHPNIATVFDFDRDGSVVFLVMELLEGVSLDRFIKSRVGRPLSRPEAMRIVEALCAALSHAHQKGLVHADFKPANAFRTHDGTIKVLDFGIARAIGRRPHDAEQTMFDPASLGALTPCYASPEMLVGDPPDPRDDVYALACVAYELFCSRHPFDFTSSLLAERRGMKPARIPGLDAGIWRALVHGLAFSRTNRTASVDAFLSELSSPRRFNFGAAAAIVTSIGLGIAAWKLVPQYLGDWHLANGQQGSEVTQASSADPEVIDVRQTELPTAKEVAAEPPASEPKAPPATAKAVVAETPKVTAPPERKPEPKQVAESPRPAEAAPVAAASATPPPTAAPEKSLSLTQRKDQFLAFVAADDIPEALTAFRVLKSELPEDDEFVVIDAPNALSQSYLRLSARAFDTGEFESSAALLARAEEFTPEAPGIAARRESLDRLAKLEHTLDNVLAISAEAIDTELEHIQMSERERYPTIRAQLAETFARRIVEVQASSPQRANELLKVARRVFAGNPSIESLQPVAERGDVAYVPQPEQRVVTPLTSESDAVAIKPD